MVEAPLIGRGKASLRLLAVWVGVAVLVATIVIVERGRDAAQSSPASRSAPDSRLLVPLPYEEMSALEIGLAGTLHRFERDKAGIWFYHAHGADPAGQAGHDHRADVSVAKTIDKALGIFSRVKMERQFSIKGNGGEYGVSPPKVIALVYRAKDPQPVAQFAFGDMAPDTVSRYVQIVGGPMMVTIPHYQVDNLENLVKAVTNPSGAAPIAKP